MSAMAVTLTVEELDALVRKAVREALAELVSPTTGRRELTEEDLAQARRSLRRFGRGAAR